VVAAEQTVGNGRTIAVQTAPAWSRLSLPTCCKLAVCPQSLARNVRSVMLTAVVATEKQRAPLIAQSLVNELMQKGHPCPFGSRRRLYTARRRGRHSLMPRASKLKDWRWRLSLSAMIRPPRCNPRVLSPPRKYSRSAEVISVEGMEV
jgi:hypothetical protein